MTMTLHLADREKQALTAACESFRHRKQSAIIATANISRDDKLRQEIRQPENQYDILSAEHSLMHIIVLLAKLTGQPIAYFTNPNPSQQSEPKTHDT